MNRLQWEIYVPIFRNRFILKGLGLAVGIPFGIVIAVIIVAAKGDVFNTDAKYALGLIALLFVLTFLLILVVYGGKYAPGFIVDETGIVNYTQDRQAGRSRIINGLLIALGAMSGSPTVVGAGMVTQSRQVIRLKWKSIRKVRYDPKRRTILVRGGYTERIVLFCTRENYARVEQMVQDQLRGKKRAEFSNRYKT